MHIDNPDYKKINDIESTIESLELKKCEIEDIIFHDSKDTLGKEFFNDEIFNDMNFQDYVFYHMISDDEQYNELMYDDKIEKYCDLLDIIDDKIMFLEKQLADIELKLLPREQSPLFGGTGYDILTGRSDGIMTEDIELIEIELFDNTVAFNIPVDSELLKQSMCITGNEPTHISVIDIPAKISSTNTPVLVANIMPSV